MARNWKHVARLALAAGMVVTALALGDTAAAAAPPLTGSWTARASMPGARFGAKAFAVAGGLLVVGDSSDSVRARNALLYDTATDTWTSAGTPAGEHSRDLAAGQALDGRVVVVGGGSGGSTAADIWDPSNRTWSALPPMAVKRDDAGVVGLADGRILVVGGDVPAYSDSSTAEIFDPASGSWSPAAAPPLGARQRPAGQLASGRVLVLSATHPAPFEAALWDPIADTWTLAAPYPAIQTPPAVTVSGGKAIGFAGEGYYGGRDAFRYDEAADAWVTLGRLAEHRSIDSATVTLPNGNLLVVGGCCARAGGSDATRSAEILDIVSGTWSGTGRLGSNHGRPALVVADNRAYVAGGYGIDAAGAVVESFDPAGTPPGFDPTISAALANYTPDLQSRRLVSATVYDRASYLPMVGVPVRMEVLPGRPTAGTVLTCATSCMTDETGRVTAGYANEIAAGTDTVRVHLDLDDDGVVGLGEPTTTIDVTWYEEQAYLTTYRLTDIANSGTGLAAQLSWVRGYECTGGGGYGGGGGSCTPLIVPIAGKTLSFYPRRSSTALCSAVTGPDGVARCPLLTTKLTAIADNGYRVEFAGDARYLAVTETRPLL